MVQVTIKISEVSVPNLWLMEGSFFYSSMVNGLMFNYMDC